MLSPTDEVFLNILACGDDKARGLISVLFCMAA